MEENKGSYVMEWVVGGQGGEMTKRKIVLPKL